VGTLQDIWNTVERERVEGWEHRAPKKRTVNAKEPKEIEKDWDSE
jgi:hypothetical protein